MGDSSRTFCLDFMGKLQMPIKGEERGNDENRIREIQPTVCPYVESRYVLSNRMGQILSCCDT